MQHLFIVSIINLLWSLISIITSMQYTYCTPSYEECAGGGIIYHVSIQ
jgi:hypothetical protein